MIGTLPPELVLRILSYLPLQSLGNVRLVSRSWNEFCVTNQCTIYHEAAVLHKFVSCIEMPLTEARETYAKGSLKDASDWYEYCRRCLRMTRDVSSLEPVIRSILLDPNTNLLTVSSKCVRKKLLELVPFVTNEFFQSKRQEFDETVVKAFYEASALLGGEVYVS
ncbi:hypothetical protein C8Q70DRAFT_548859 [Cubamyces menziesii]|nr:hypothetical protein C8Q70DRAFT_548859 [Cubamyces menziesii]